MFVSYNSSDYGGNVSGGRQRGKKRGAAAETSSGDSQPMRSTGRQTNVRVRRSSNNNNSNNPAGQVAQNVSHWS